jgi:DNA (cytosine-5)-methyltransferase 1
VPELWGPLARPVTLHEEDRGWRLIKGFRNSSYRRMPPDRPAATITTASGRVGSDYTLHPSENRVLSVLECQHLQTIPAEFDWGDHLEVHGHTSLRAMIGEAVPPQFTELHGRCWRAFSTAMLREGRCPRATSACAQRRECSRLRRREQPTRLSLPLVGDRQSPRLKCE